MDSIISSILNNNVESLKQLLSNELQRIFSGDCKVKIDNELAKITTIYLHEESAENPNLNFNNQQSEFVRILLNQGANDGNSDKGFCQIGLDFFNFICKFATVDVVQFLIKHGRFLYCKDKWDLIRILHALSCGKEELYMLLINDGLGAAEINRLHLLHYGVKSGIKSEEIIEKFLQVGADVNGLNEEEHTVFDLAMEGEKLKVIKVLIENEAKVNQRKIYDECCKVFNYAVQNQETGKKVVELMLERETVPKNSTIFEAIENGNLNTAKLLLSVRLDATCSTDEESPIFEAISNNNLKAVKLLLDFGVNINEPNSHGLYPLFYAVKHSKGKIIKLLLNNGADVNVRDNHGFTALMIATSPYRWAMYYGLFAQMQNTEILVQLLLDFGADINVMRGNGSTALTYAIAKGKIGVWKILVKQMALMKSQGSFINDVNLTTVKESEQVALFYAKCLSELDLLTSMKFDDSDLSYFDIYKIKDVRRLAHLARNPSIFDVIKSDGFIDEFPNYGKAIVKNFNRGVARNKDFELVKRFVNYLSVRDHDQLPKLPIVVVSKLFTFFNDNDVATLWEL